MLKTKIYLNFLTEAWKSSLNDEYDNWIFNHWVQKKENILHPSCHKNSPAHSEELHLVQLNAIQFELLF